MKTPIISIACFLAAAVLGALGQYLYKSGADAWTGGITSLLLSPRIVLGVVWGALISKLAFNTPITAANMTGMGLLVAGMCLMGMQ